ncbi:hypothetical protein CG716_25525 [Mycolicibacterium sphagni]|uniref:Uncharacterized protein n=1 Tax=Mycolicibacterium sphagni TaxID=1786 RepID=A0A255D7P3_9MYCO|nr:hypothetical protein CG716_25525 [Mycolicibacterium sphagni]
MQRECDGQEMCVEVVAVGVVGDSAKITDSTGRPAVRSRYMEGLKIEVRTQECVLPAPQR